jgi:uncharacterized protein YaaQ
MMKMIVAILPNTLSEEVSEILVENGYRVTKFASTARFLQGGTTTLMIGIEASQVDETLALIRDHVPQKENQIQATIYVINIKMFERI